MNALIAAVMIRDRPLIRRYSADLRAVAEAYNQPPQLAFTAFLDSWLKAQEGSFEAGELRGAFEQVAAIGPMTLLYVTLYAETLTQHGRADEALEMIDRYIGALKFPFGFNLAEVHRARAESLAALGRTAEALAQFAEGEAIAEKQGATLFADRLRASRARLPAAAAPAGP